MPDNRSFKFVSPGVQIREVDKSQLPKQRANIGPVVIGRTQRGPALIPVTVGSFSEFVDVFGAPSRGVPGNDIWRGGDLTSPTYASYAAEAWLKNSTPLTFIRLAGIRHNDPVSTGFQDPGWKTNNVAASTDLASNGGAYGLFIIPSSSAYNQNITGALAAVWYLDEGGIRLIGNDMNDHNSIGDTGAGAFVRSIGNNYEFEAQISDQSNNKVIRTTFNFNPNSSKYIRKVFNTNPTLTNNEITPASNLKTYWLGETYETFLKSIVNQESGNIAGRVHGCIVALENNVANAADFQGNLPAQPARTGWVFSQQLSNATGTFDATQMDELFRFVSNRGDSGEWEQRNLKVSIFNIKPSPTQNYKYGTFSVGIRDITDTDANPRFLEVFSNLNLDPTSPDFIAQRIGDKTVTWDASEKRYRELGKFDNKSRFITVEMAQIVEQGGLDPELLPFGFYGPPRFNKITVNSGSLFAAGDMAAVSGSIPFRPIGGGDIWFPGNLGGNAQVTASLHFPRLQLRVSSSDGGTLKHKDVYFGPIFTKPSSSKFDPDVVDLVRAKPDGINSYITDASTEYSFVFTLDDIVGITGSNESSYWLSGSRRSGLSLSASGSVNPTGSVDGYKAVLNRGHDKFTLPLFGGFDGLDITERDPFRNTFLSKGQGTDRGNYAVASVKRALEMITDPEVLDFNLLAAPGITHNPLTKEMLEVCEKRGDALAIIDIDGGYVPESENSDVESLRLGSVTDTVRRIKDRVLNSSYGCCYYPWVKILDSETNQPVWVPPSVVALGTMAFSQEKTQVWFAPAGFNRGGLTKGSSGLTVVDVREKLLSKQRDALYEVNINPIASFPSEGIVIFGQKTLQSLPSALDRINVRRMMLFMKKEFSIIANGLLFEPNVDNTWARFLAQAKPVCERVQAGFGITEFKLILDKTTTTPELIDRNIMYAKVLIKPAYSAETFLIDMVVTNNSVGFDGI